MLYISDIFNVDTKEHYDRIKSFTQAQMMYCVELRDFTTGEQRAMCMPKVVVVEEIILFGVVCQSMHYYMQLNNLFDIILSGELDLQDVSSMYSRIDDRITVIYSGYMHKGYRYKYEYKITDLDKFQLLLTKISIRYSKFF